jgi:hypothetical protein
MNLLLKKIGFSVKNSRKANGKRNKNGNRCFDYTFTAQAIVAVDQLCQQRQQARQTWMDTKKNEVDASCYNRRKEMLITESVQ